jgi:hypothetical protein
MPANDSDILSAETEVRGQHFRDGSIGRTVDCSFPNEDCAVCPAMFIRQPMLVNEGPLRASRLDVNCDQHGHNVTAWLGPASICKLPSNGRG